LLFVYKGLHRGRGRTGKGVGRSKAGEPVELVATKKKKRRWGVRLIRGGGVVRLEEKEKRWGDTGERGNHCLQLSAKNHCHRVCTGAQESK